MTNRDLPPERTDGVMSQNQIAMSRYAWAGTKLSHIKGLVADVGCGMGYGMAILGGMIDGAEIIGIDIDEDAVRHAHERYSAPVICADVSRQRLFGFQAAVCLEAMSHLLDPYVWLKNLEVPELVLSMPSTPSKAVYPWRKHDITVSTLMNWMEPRWRVKDHFEQVSSSTEKYITLYGVR